MRQRGRTVALRRLGCGLVLSSWIRYSDPPARPESGNCPIFLSGSRLAGRLDETMTHGEQGRLGPGFHPELGVDVLQVRRDGLAAELQLGGDLGVGPPL